MESKRSAKLQSQTDGNLDKRKCICIHMQISEIANSTVNNDQAVLALISLARPESPKNIITKIGAIPNTGIHIARCLVAHNKDIPRGSQTNSVM